MANFSATPTPITPPRVPLIDARTGLIDRAWYMFFLSLFQTSQVVDSTQIGSNAESLIASYDEALRTLAQATETAPATGVTELAQEVSNLRQEVKTLPQPQLGTFAALQQANLPWTTFDATPEHVPTDVGTVAWDGGTTLGIQMTTNVLQRVGESEYVYAKASAAITKGQLCYHTGAVGASGVITVAPTPIGLTDPNQIVGVAAETLGLNDFGLIQVSGDLRGFNTTGSSVGETWADGDPLYYNPAYVGQMTKVKPSAPNQKSYIGEVTNAAPSGSGSMHIRIVPGSVLGGTDSNVQFGTLADKDIIQYDSTLTYWKNVAPSAVTFGTATNLAGGVAGSVPYQTAASTTTFLPIGTAAQVLKVNSGATAPEWVSGAALTKVDDTNVTLTLGGSPTTALLSAASITAGWTGTLATTRGGTGLSSFTANGVVYASSTSALTTGSSLTFNGTNLGVGLASPSYKLDVSISSGPFIARFNNTSTSTSDYNVILVGQNAAGSAVGYFGTGGSTVGNTSFANNFVVGTTTSNPLVFNTGDTERARITNTGNLLVGTTNNLSGEPLQIDGNGVGATVYTALIRNTSTSTSVYNIVRWGQNASGSAVGYIGTGGSAVGNPAFQNTFVVGTQTSNPLVFNTSDVERARITSTGNFVAGGSVALATTATDGFLYVPTCAGTPTGTPTAITGMAPIVVDTTNNKLYFYSGGAWRDAGP
jgi:hypothetical protein